MRQRKEIQRLHHQKHDLPSTPWNWWEGGEGYPRWRDAVEEPARAPTPLLFVAVLHNDQDLRAPPIDAHGNARIIHR